jgi:hypothetical protein
VQLPVTLALRPSRMLTGLLWLAHVAALPVVVSLTLPWWTRLALAMLVALSLWRGLRQQRRAAVRRLVLRRDGVIEIFPEVDADGTLCELHAATVLGGLVMLELRPPAGSRALTLLPDSATPDDLRRLRVWLAWRKSTA